MVNATPRPLCPWEGDFISTVGGWVGPKAGLEGRGNYGPIFILKKYIRIYYSYECEHFPLLSSTSLCLVLGRGGERIYILECVAVVLLEMELTFRHRASSI